jgi:hypothetical protein
VRLLLGAVQDVLSSHACLQMTNVRSLCLAISLRALFRRMSAAHEYAGGLETAPVVGAGHCATCQSDEVLSGGVPQLWRQLCDVVCERQWLLLSPAQEAALAHSTAATSISAPLH